MPYKDPEKQKEYQREWQRMKKAGESGKPSIRTLNPEDVRTAQGIRDMLSEVLAEVQAWKGDTLQRARCIGYIAAIAIKAVETADLESRLAALEEDMERKGDRNH